jgi:hypothetical protein
MLGFFLKNMLIYIKDANKKGQQKGVFVLPFLLLYSKKWNKKN